MFKRKEEANVEEEEKTLEKVVHLRDSRGRFVEGTSSYRRGIHLSEEMRRKLSIAHKGKKFTVEHKRNLSLALKGNEKLRKAATGRKLSASTKKLISLHNGQTGKPSWRRGLTKETDERIRRGAEKESLTLKRMGMNVGESNPAFNNWSSREPYGEEFSPELKLLIRQRDAFTCQLCGLKENGYSLDVHHIDYDKRNNNPENLITLCRSCHGKIQFHRASWIRLFSLENINIGRK